MRDVGREPDRSADPVLVPPEVARAAAAHGLGAPVLTHRSGPDRVWLPLWGGFLFGVITIVLAVGPSTVWTPAGPATAGCAGLLLTHAIQLLSVAGTGLYLFDHGVVHRKGGAVTAFPWRDTRLWRSVVRDRFVKHPYRYRLQRPGAPPVVLSPALDLHEFGPEMERRLTAERTPVDLAAAAAGRRVGYGPFTVDRHGLTTPKGFIPWARVRGAEVGRRGRVRVWQAGARRPVRVRGRTVPNVVVFLAVVDAMRRA